ncbi:uncharacterized protein JCM6883_003702 [Sporobolomyces salmoneus]|uniref:uncharacterized protein n=1 Tax=Sporobolomyces salmoneus TaxID=183962 RepID=UPI0031717864
MMDRMNRTTSPSPSFTPPPRTSSRASSHTRLSTHSSAHSLHSARSGSPRPSSPLSSRPSAEVNPDEVEDETTPSMRQGEWGRRTLNHSRARTTSDNRGLQQRNYDDDTNSLRSTRSRLDDDSSAPSPNSFYAAASSPATTTPFLRSPHTSPPPRPRPVPSLNSTPANSPQVGQSPLRLLPRSPLNDRAPLDDLAFLREAGAFADEDELSTLQEIKSRTETDSSSINSSNSTSLRNARLREDIERTAQRIKARGSSEDVNREPSTSPIPPAPPPAAAPQVPDTTLPTTTRRPSIGVASNLPLYPGAPLPPATTSYDDSFDDRSLYSLASAGADSTGTWPGSSNSRDGPSTSARSEYATGKGDRQPRMRQKESKEWSQACWIWIRDKGSTKDMGSSSGGSKFSKAPLIRDVPSALKRKSGKRESAHHLLSPTESTMFNFDDSSKSSRSTSSKEKTKEKGKPPIGPVAGDKDGTWRRATGVLRDDGYFRVFGESDKVIIHSIHLPSFNRTDVRLTDHSLFGRPNCVSISHRTASPATPHYSSFASSSMSASISSGSPRSSLEEAVYLCFPSVVATQVWLAMAHCFALPEYYLASGAATPRPIPPTPSARRSRNPSWPSSDEGESFGGDGTEELEKSCRIYRKLHLTINEGRALGESMTETNRPGAKSSWDRPGMSREGSNNGDGVNDLQSPGALDSPSKSIASSLPSSRPRGMEGKEDHSGVGWMCEVEMDGEVVARTAVKRGSSAFWNDSFTFSDLPPFTSPITIRVLQSSKSSSRFHVLGVATVRIPDLPRHELLEDWWSVKPVNSAKMTDVVGELNLGIRVGEEVVLPSREYETMLKLLTDDIDAELAVDIAQEFPSELEELTSILLRIYQAESLLIPRVLRLADLEIDSNNRLNRSTAILFRGNTILTKSVELYLRLIGAEYLEASIGETIRKIIKDKVEIEIDPMKLKSGYKDKELLSNVHALHEWTTTLWNSIYDARERCPQDLRQIFGHIQRIVVEKYGVGEDQKNTRWTSVSAFIFLRFFVPAVLNPRLFLIVSNPPDSKSQRTLTLIAKTLQGLANFSSFGQKEPWMLPMNSFVQDNGAAFVDFIEHVATPVPAAAHRQEWTSPLASTYLAPYRLRNSLSPLAKEGVALLPHLIDLPRELGLLATHLARWTAEQASSHDREGSAGVAGGRSGTPSVTSLRGESSQRFVELAEASAEAHNEARRRGGGLVSALNYYDFRLRQPELRTRAGAGGAGGGGGGGRMTGRPATSAGSYGVGAGNKVKGLSGGPSPSRPSSTSTTEELLHIRNPSRPSTPPPRSRASTLPQSEEFEGSGGDTSAKRRSHRSFTINGSSPNPKRSGIVSGGGLRSLSSEDLARLVSVQTRPPLEAIDTELKPPLLDNDEALTPLTANEASRPPIVDAPTLFDSDDLQPESDPAVPSPQTPRSSSSAVPMSKASSTHSSSTVSSTGGRSTPRVPPITRVHINQETTISTTHVSQLGSASPTIPLGMSGTVVATQTPELPTETEFSPLRSPGAISSPVLGSRSPGGGIPASTSTMSINAEVSAPFMGRRSSAAGIGIFGLGKSSKYSSGGTGGGDDDTSSGSSGSRGGLLSRAMGRKGSKS